MPEKQWNLYSVMRSTIGADCGMIFGATGSGKSMLTRAVVQSAVEQGIKVAMCDTEANYTEEDIQWLNANTKYHHTSGLQGIKAWINGLAKDFDVIVLDSIGGPAYGEYTAAANAKLKGNIFQSVAEVMYAIQKYCQDNGAMGMVVNQPTSEFAVGGASKAIEPFGGKGNFYSKETIMMEGLPHKDGFSWAGMKVWKSRHMRSGMVFAKLAISDTRVGVQFAQYEGRQAKGWPEVACTLMNPLLSDEKEKVKIKGQQTTEPEKEPTKPEPEPEKQKGNEPVKEIPIELDESEEEQLQSARTAISGLIDVKNISEELFVELAERCSIEAQFPEQINDLQEALNLKSVMEKLPKQEDTESGKKKDTFL